MTSPDKTVIGNNSNQTTHTPKVLLLSACEIPKIRDFLHLFELTLSLVDAAQQIPGSFWGDSEAGLIAHTIYARHDTPLHSLLHESCHFICMDQTRRASLHTNAKGNASEENAVCYLQIILADYCPNMNRERMLQDMGAWGYSFRLGSAKAWFEEDAEDAQQWLIEKNLLTPTLAPTFTLRKD